MGREIQLGGIFSQLNIYKLLNFRQNIEVQMPKTAEQICSHEASKKE